MLFQSKHPLHSIYRAWTKLELKMHRNSLVPSSYSSSWRRAVDSDKDNLFSGRRKKYVAFMRIHGQKRFHEAARSTVFCRVWMGAWMEQGEVNSIGL